MVFVEIFIFIQKKTKTIKYENNYNYFVGNIGNTTDYWILKKLVIIAKIIDKNLRKMNK